MFSEILILIWVVKWSTTNIRKESNADAKAKIGKITAGFLQLKNISK